MKPKHNFNQTPDCNNNLELEGVIIAIDLLECKDTHYASEIAIESSIYVYSPPQQWLPER